MEQHQGLRVRTAVSRPETRFAREALARDHGVDASVAVTPADHSAAKEETEGPGPSGREDPRELNGWRKGFETWSLPGLAAYGAFLLASVAYFGVRLRQLQDLGPYWWYGAIVLGAELVGTSAVVLYGLCIIRQQPPTKPARPGVTCRPYNVQVLVPCYTEPIEIVAETVWAAHQAALPRGCSATVWLLDDGKDEDKAAWVSGLATPTIRYISGRKRPSDEVNGKAGNLNNALRLIYPPGGDTSPEDVVAVFDCDQVCEPEFFLRTLPLLDEAPEIALVLTPQRFGNTDEDSDIFNHTNRHFWEAMIPGLTAWGMVVCTGSNLLLRSSALTEVGGFPARTITEDYVLGMELCKHGFQSRYLLDYLAVGEAPEEGATFRQRSRWCKGHMQALLSRECPLLQSGLSPLMRILYTAGTWSYLCAALTTPIFASIPVIAVATGVFPLAVTAQFAAAFVPYFVLMHTVVYWCDSWGLLRALWFGSIATQILWFTYLKAVWNTTLWALGLKKKGRFKTTIKTGVLANTPRPTALSVPGTPKSYRPSLDSPLGQSSPLRGSGNFASVTQLARRRGEGRDQSPGTPKPGTPSAARGPAGAFEWALLERENADERGPEGGERGPEGGGEGGSEADAKRRETGESKEGGEGDAAAGGLLRGPSDLAGGDVTHGGLEMPLARQITMPELLRQLTETGGRRPGWNLEVAGQTPGGASFQARDFTALVIKQIGFGTLRDVWALLLVLLLSGGAALLGLGRVVMGVSSAPLALSAMWAAYNCIGPALLLHYTWLGREANLRRAARLAMVACAAVLLAAPLALHLAVPSSYEYGKVLGDSYLFYEAQRSGELPQDNRIAWRGDSGLQDQAPDGTPLVGGWYDAGDHLKASMSIGVAASLLAWGLLEFRQGHELAGQLSHARTNLRWAGDYLMACHLAPNTFVAQVGDAEEDHAYWGRPEDMGAAGLRRPAYLLNVTHPGSDIVAAAAAALAATSEVYKAADPAYARQTLSHARQLFDFADNHRGLAGDSVPNLAAVYPASAYLDDLAWAAAWLYVSSGEKTYRTRARGFLEESRRVEPGRWQYYVSNWDNMQWNAQLLVGRATGDRSLLAASADFLDRWRMGKVVTYTRRGLAYSDDWGTLRNSANSALLALIYARHYEGTPRALPYSCWAASQIRYMLGDAGRSFVVGYGRRPPLRPHHRAASCPPVPTPCDWAAFNTQSANPNTLTGALVGGPYRNDTYADDRTDYVRSEVGVEYNAGFTAALAALNEDTTPWTLCLQRNGRAMWS